MKPSFFPCIAFASALTLSFVALDNHHGYIACIAGLAALNALGWLVTAVELEVEGNHKSPAPEEKK